MKNINVINLNRALFSSRRICYIDDINKKRNKQIMQTKKYDDEDKEKNKFRMQPNEG